MPPVLVLFDIDGTLLRPMGLGRRSIDDAFFSLYGQRGVLEDVRFHGRTDPDIFEDGLSRAGVDHSDYDRILDAYLNNLSAEVERGPSLVLEGVVDCLRALSIRPEVTLGIVTGNVKRGADIKLAKDDLHQWFATGAYACDHRERAQLIRIAKERAETLCGQAIEPGRLVYVGDTENDVRAAKDAGALAIAVASGGMDKESLAAEDPDHLFDGLHAMENFMKVLP